MTREEASNILDDYDVNFEGHAAEEIAEAFEVAFRALEQEPCEDAISRQAVLEYIEGSEAELGHSSENELVCQDIKELPPINPQAKTGYWIEHPEIETSAPEYLMFYECSECGDRQCFCKSDIHKKHFCNNCGARMVEPQESEVNNG